MKTMPIILAGLGALAAACTPVEPKPAAWPEQMKMEAPGPGVPAETAAFAGRWAGTWGSDVDTKLVVSSVSPQGLAEIIYLYGSLPGRWDAGRHDTTGHIVGNVLTLDSTIDGSAISYTLQEDGALRAQHSLRGTNSFATLHRAEPGA